MGLSDGILVVVSVLEGKFDDDYVLPSREILLGEDMQSVICNTPQTPL